MLKQTGVFLLWCFFQSLLLCAIIAFYTCFTKILPEPGAEGILLGWHVAALIGFVVILFHLNPNYHKSKFHKAFYKGSLEWFYMDYSTLIKQFFEIYTEEYEIRNLRLDKKYEEMDHIDENFAGISKEELKRINNLKPFDLLFCRYMIKDYLNDIDVKLGLFEDKFTDMLSDDIRKYHEDHFN